MDTTYETRVGQLEERAEKKQWITARYAPAKYDRTGAAAHKLIKTRRNEKVLAEKALKEEQRADLAKEAQSAKVETPEFKQARYDKYQKRMKKEAARKFYKKRVAEKNKIEAANPKAYIGKTLNARLKIYNRHHSCGCQLKFNKIFLKDNQYNFSCTHLNSTILEKDCDTPCENCGFKTTFKYKNSDCQCIYYVCYKRCGYSTFHYESLNYNYHQYYDKHSAKQDTIHIDPIHKRGTIRPADFPKPEVIDNIYVAAVQQIEDKKLSRATRKNFFLELQGKKAISYSKVLTHTTKESENVPTTSLVETPNFPPLEKPIKVTKYKFARPKYEKPIPTCISYEEGGKESKPTSKEEDKSTDSTTSEVKKQFTSAIDKIKKIRDDYLTSKIFQKIKDHPKTQELIKFFDLVIYALKVFRGYLDITNMLLIIDLIKDFSLDILHTTTSALRLLHLTAVMIQNEQNSKKLFERLVLYCKEKNTDYTATVLFRQDFGCLTTAIRKWLIDEKIVSKRKNYYIFNYKLDRKLEGIDICEKFGIFSHINPLHSRDSKMFQTEDKIDQAAACESTEQSGFVGLITNLCSFIPKSFGSAIPMFSQLCKTLLPMLAVTKFTTDISKTLWKGIDTFIEWWTGRYQNPKEWLSSKIYTPGNPINDLQIAYMAYRSKNYCSSVAPGVEIETLRTRYYEYKVAAEKYATEEKQYSQPFASFLKSHEQGMSEPHKPHDRPFEPTVLCFAGEAGSGKSTAWPIVVAKALGLENSEDPIRAVKETTYTWNTASEYMTGMSGKRVILFDDFGQDKQESTEALNLIHLVTSAAFAINSANITGTEIKGMFANPEIIVICTNDNEFNSQLLLSKEAVIRRLDLVLEFSTKLDLDNLDHQNINIHKCERYREFEKSSISILEAATIFTVLNAQKKQSFADLKGKVNDAIGKQLAALKIVAKGNKKDIHKDTFIMKCQNFQKDFAAYQTTNQTQEKEEEDNYSTFPQRPTTSKDSVVSKPEHGSLVEHLYDIFRISFTQGITWGTSMAVILGWYSFSLEVANIDLSFIGLKRILKRLLKAALITLGACGILLTVKKFLFDSAESGTTKTAKTANKILGVVPSIPESSEVFTTLVHKATGTLKKDDGTIVNCIFIGGHYILTVNHFFQDYESTAFIKDGSKLQITKSTWSKRVREFEFQQKDIVYLSGGVNVVNGRSVREDIVLYRLDFKMFNAEKKIWHHFWNAEYSLVNFPVSKLDYVSSSIYRTAGDEDQLSTHTGVVTTDRIFTQRIKGIEVYWHLCAEATYQGRSASCGSAIIATHTQETPILGIHIAATAGGKSLFHFVTRDSIQVALASQIQMDLEENGSEPGTQSLLPEGSILEFVGNVKPAYQNTKTDLTPSSIAGMFGQVQTEPSTLSPMDPRLRTRPDAEYVRRNFYKILFEGYNQNPHFYERELREAAEYLKLKNREIKSKSIVKNKILTLEETMNGIDFLPQNTKIEMTTSPGYPYTTQGLKRTDLFSVDDDIISASPRIRKDFEDTLSKFRNGIVPFTPFTLTIKDERLKLKKIYQDLKPRLFASGNIIHLLVSRRYFYTHIMSHYHSQDSYTSIRMDRLSLDWHEMIMYLLEGGSIGFDLDYAFFDRTICKLLVYLGIEINLDYIKPDIIKDLGHIGYKTLIEWDSSPFYVFLNKLFRAINGTMPSGKLTTFTQNCDMNELLHIAGFLAITAKTHPLMSNIISYNRHNRGKRGGDDTIQTISETIKDIFNGQIFAQWINEHGMRCTAADKSDDSVPYKRLSELSFLKNTTGFMRGFYVPHTDKTSIYEMMYWVRLNKQNNDIHKATQDNINAALRCLYFYGDTEYNLVRNAILKKFPGYNLNTYLENRRIWDTYFYFPGSHSDYATREDQGLGIMIDAQVKYEPSPTKNQLTITMQEVQSFEEVGEDKASRNMGAEHPIVDNTTIVGGDLKVESSNTSVDDTEKSRVKQIGTTIQEAEKPIHGTLTTAQKSFTSPNSRAEAHCNDINWNLEYLEEKYTMIDTKEWTITDKAETILWSFNIPNDILATPAMKTPFDVTAFWRPKAVKFRVIVKCGDFYSGTLICGFYPSMLSLTPLLVAETVDCSVLNQLGGVKMHCSDNQEANFQIPFRHIYGFMEAPLDLLGQFIVMVQNPLRTGAANINNVQVTLYAAMDNSEFKIPEFVPETEYKSLKFVKSVPQSGKLTTEIKSVGQVSINDNINAMKPVMLCAGKGLVTEPKVKQFQDHPVDIVQLRKRFRTIYSFPVICPAADHRVTSFPVQDAVRQLVGSYAEVFKLYRGSLNFKVLPFINSATRTTPIDPTFKQNVSFKARLVQNTDTAQEQELDMAELDGNYLGGAHYFKQGEPGEFMAPYMSPMFTSTFYDLDVLDPFFIQQGVISIEVRNFNKYDDIEVTLEIIACLSDDFTMGVFIGTPTFMIPTAPEVRKKFEIRASVEESGRFKGLEGCPPRPPSGDLGTPIRIGVGRSTDVRAFNIGEYSSGEIEYNKLIDKALQGKTLTKGQERRFKERFNDPASLSLPEAMVASKLPHLLYKTIRDPMQDSVKVDEVESVPEAGIMEFIDKAMETTLPVLENLDELANLLDAHPVTYQRYPITNREIGYTIPTDLIQYLERLLATNHNGLSLTDKEAYGGKEKETDIYKLMQNTMSLYDKFTWTTTQATGTLLTTYQVGPVTPTEFKNSAPMDCFAPDFMYWNGSVIYIIDIIATKLHKGQLTVSFHPNLTESPATLREATQQYFTTFDLSNGRATIALQVPYLQKKPYLPVYTVGKTAYDVGQCFNGILCLWVQNSLRATNVVSDTVDINIYKVAGPDFKLDVYGQNGNIKEIPSNKRKAKIPALKGYTPI
jgi:hypothetical protein